MSYAKRRLAVFLSMLMLFSVVLCAMPAQMVQAAGTTVYISWRMSTYGTDLPELQVKKGASDLYVGDYGNASVSSYSSSRYGALSTFKGVKYSSSNKSIVTVNESTGKMNAKKNGTATITVKLNGTMSQCKIKVVSSTKAFDNGYYNGKADARFVKAYGSKITASNRYALLSLYNAGGFDYSGGVGSMYVGSKYVYGVYNPTAARCAVLRNEFSTYKAARNPLSTYSGKMVFVPKKISGSKKNITVTLNGKVTEEQLFGLQGILSWDTEVKKLSKVDFPIYVKDVKTNHRYFAVATVQKNSNIMKITTRNLTMKKGTQYQLIDASYNNWLENKQAVVSFKAK